MAASVVALGAAREASACPEPGQPWVRVTAVDEAGALRARDVARLLGAELAARHIATCDAPAEGSPPPIAVVLVRASGESASVTVDVRDAVTAKAVSRDVALVGVPADSRALTVALAADELLRASWAELAMRSAPPPPKPVPPEVRAVVRDAVTAAPERPPRFAFGAAAAVDTFTAGTTLLGADVTADVWIVPRLRATARFGLRTGLVAHAADGDVSSNALVFELGAAVTLTPPELRLGLDAALRAGLLRVAFVATPANGASARSLGDVAVIGDADLVFWLRLGRSLRAVAELGAVLPMRPVEATDGSAVVGGVAGAGLTSSLGLRGTF